MLPDEEPVAGSLVELDPGLFRLVAPNPSVMTGPGTNTYFLGTSDLLVIDPGPLDEGHLEAIKSFASGRLRYVLVTHHHGDHAPLAPVLARDVGATLLGRGFEDDFTPDAVLSEGDVVAIDGWSVTALHTPGHASDHLCFLSERTALSERPSAEFERVLFTGDHVMAGSTVAIAPPDGDMEAYLASLRRLRELEPPPEVIAPGHGGLLREPASVLEYYIRHREEREQLVLDRLRAGPARADELAAAIYRGLGDRLLKAATATIWAHLRKLTAEEKVRSADPDDPQSIFELAS